MELVKFTKLKGVNVVTESGTDLGVLYDVELEISTLRCINILVRPANIIKKIINNHLIISTQDVVKITNEKIIVLDSVVRENGSKVTLEELSSNSSAQIVNSEN